MGALDAALGSPPPAHRLATYAVALALAVALLAQSALGVVQLARGGEERAELAAMRYVHIFQTPEHAASNVMTAKLARSGALERALLYALFLLFAGVIAAVAWTAVRVRRGDAPMPDAGLLLRLGAAALAASLYLAVMVPSYAAACKQAARARLMRTLFNNGVYNSLLDGRPAFTAALVADGPTAALAALSPGKPASPAAHAPAGHRGALATAVARVDAAAWRRAGPGFLKLYRAVVDWAAGVSRETVVQPTVARTDADAWVAALVTINVYHHVARNVPRQSPAYPDAMAVFAADDLTRRETDLFSYFVYGQYAVLDNRAPSYKALIPPALQGSVLRRVQQRMAILNGLCDKATGGVLQAADVYAGYATRSALLVWGSVAALAFVLRRAGRLADAAS